jgi:putative tryptophan/tyrosine transport system permease protein
MIEGIFVEGLIYGIMVLGVFITFRVLDFPDLTVDGTFPLGGALAAYFILNGYPVGIALLLAFAGGMLAGAVTAVIHTRLKVPGLLAGILTMTMLYSVIIRILGNRANASLLNHDTIITDFSNLMSGFIPDQYAELLLFFIVILVIKLLLDLFFITDIGIALGALGNNEQMIVSQGVNPEIMKLVGIGLSNGLVALAGAFAAQYQGFADVNMGQGIIITGLASVMIGEQFLRSSRSIIPLTFFAIAGSVIYKGIMYLGRSYGYRVYLTPNDLKLITGILIVVLLVATRTNMLKRAIGFRK